MNYVFRCITAAGAMPFEYKSNCRNDVDATEYARKAALQFVACPWFLGLDVFAYHEDEGKHVARIRVDVIAQISWKST